MRFAAILLTAITSTLAALAAEVAASIRVQIGRTSVRRIPGAKS